VVVGAAVGSERLSDRLPAVAEAPFMLQMANFE
jgi:hypothetical protein